ncbi:unnamed protein product [Albugo candida]|uniref:Uncharacterized protein n=1 Tax=Albugo candida TaxID=65357 RepID=A0A024GL69_9STRA|nr:unnamed protein product [Albugo candida]|eukprot:CCI47275.1 unnamed protein product [Albugo candida]
MKENAGHSIEELSKINFFIRSQANLKSYSISNCISSSCRSDLSKKAVRVSDEFCFAYNFPPPERLDSNCVLDCVDLEMGGWEHFDVSSIPPISSDSIKARFSLIKVGHSHFFAGN